MRKGPTSTVRVFAKRNRSRSFRLAFTIEESHNPALSGRAARLDARPVRLDGRLPPGLIWASRPPMSRSRRDRSRSQTVRACALRLCHSRAGLMRSSMVNASPERTRTDFAFANTRTGRSRPFTHLVLGFSWNTSSSSARALQDHLGFRIQDQVEAVLFQERRIVETPRASGLLVLLGIAQDDRPRWSVTSASS